MTFLMYSLTLYLHFLLLSISYGFLIDFQVDLYLHLDCIFTYTLLTMFFTLHIPHRYVSCLFIDFSKPSLSTFNWFEFLSVFLSYMVVLLCTVHIVRSH